ncbi:M3 family metallopeptidase [Agrobacterium sp. SHOUNA12C]|uniref:Peptidyl-dipeptidase Dcp n=1 Tax=Rhizobium rhizogenes NBRC 13257 TaxID=1220581 RepID=A0AA87Q7K4_RHIRH|nr:M3 family metallopeptidase [Rhizobium rhizogenes]MCJ9725033.1 M3 family metallopeptidase [Agrobacterium sp. BETTINA12B]MCJ9759656.1 M3 family metallopeptidase [Agrobacterium sp. SHOUNA12C]NTF56632.1 M3 family metallopeptidase [Rhizobium rhizogenes]NTF69687.1 M3 family metallopeptidase [Rhizobium rhizogenes]NTF76213.1 M3 family metallopeptidase [Rhizobium rhizogenes]
MSSHAAVNPALVEWTGHQGLPRFDAVKDADFAPAFDAALASHETEIEAIAKNGEAPTFANTVTALEIAGDALSRVSALFWNKAGAHTNEVIQTLERQIAPKISRHYSKIGMNAALFARIDALWEGRDALGLTLEETRVLERHWKGFVKSGAKLPKVEQERLATINETLAGLGAQFGQNVLGDEKSWALILSEDADLAGLPDYLKDAMAAAARERGEEGKYAVTLSRSIIEPFLTASERRDLREQAFKAWVARGENGGETDNRKIIRETLALRAEKAKLLGYANFAELKLDNTMAKTPEAVNDLLKAVWAKAAVRAGEEEADIAALISQEGRNHEVMPWDWRHYAEKIRTQKFDFSEAELKPYLQLEKIIAACFDVAGRLFGIRAVEQKGVPAYHPDVRVFEIRDRSDRLVALFLGDYFARSSKRSGAWMSSFQSQHKLRLPNGDVGELPIIYNVCNFAKPAEGKPALLSLDDARTLFHEFGHALHGMLSNVTYPSVAGTGVSRDFVELPSQLYEHWLTVPAILKEYAVHYETGAPIPQALLDKVLAARTFNAGFNTVEFTSSALVDMAFHTRGAVEDPMAVQAEVLSEIGMPKSIVMRHATPHFQHVFSGDGYSAGYYSYMWSEVLDADAFSAFEETGDAFNAQMAEKLKANIYSVGGSIDPEDAYKAFRGKLPSPDAMLKKKGLAA